MDATGSRTPRAGAASTPGAGLPLDETQQALGDLSGEALQDLIRRGHALLFLPGPLFDEMPALDRVLDEASAAVAVPER